MSRRWRKSRRWAKPCNEKGDESNNRRGGGVSGIGMPIIGLIPFFNAAVRAGTMSGMNQDRPIAGPIVPTDKPRDSQLPDEARLGAAWSRPGVRVTLRSFIVWITTFAIVLSVYVNWRLVSFAVFGVAMGLATFAFIVLAVADWLERRIEALLRNREPAGHRRRNDDVAVVCRRGDRSAHVRTRDAVSVAKVIADIWEGSAR